jgi:hypothetical protein
MASRLMEARRGWCTWHHCGGGVELKLKTDESMRWAASDPSTPILPFFFVFGPGGILVFYSFAYAYK